MEQQLRQLRGAEEASDEWDERSVIAPLVDVDDKGRRRNLEFGEHLLDLSEPRVAHLAHEDDGEDRADLSDEQVKIIPSGRARRVKVENDGWFERDRGVEGREHVGGGGGDELRMSAIAPSEKRSTHRDERGELILSTGKSECLNV